MSVPSKPAAAEAWFRHAHAMDVGALTWDGSKFVDTKKPHKGGGKGGKGKEKGKEKTQANQRAKIAPSKAQASKGKGRQVEKPASNKGASTSGTKAVLEGSSSDSDSD